MTISDNTVAIIGTGNIGSRLAANFAAGGQDFLLADRDQETARKLASGLGGHAEVVSIDQAVEQADVLVFALWLDAFEQLIAQYGDRLVLRPDPGGAAAGRNTAGQGVRHAVGPLTVRGRAAGTRACGAVLRRGRRRRGRPGR